MGVSMNMDIISYMVCSYPNMVYIWSVSSIWGKSGAQIRFQNWVQNLTSKYSKTDIVMLSKGVIFCTDNVRNKHGLK